MPLHSNKDAKIAPLNLILYLSDLDVNAQNVLPQLIERLNNPDQEDRVKFSIFHSRDDVNRKPTPKQNKETSFSEREFRIYSMHNGYPSHDDELISMINDPKQSSIDGIISLVSKQSTQLVSSLSGPESTPYTLHREYDKTNEVATAKRLGELDIFQFISECTNKFGRNWVDITIDEINVLHLIEGQDQYISMDVNTLYHNFVKLCTQLAIAKEGFDLWSKDTTIIDVSLNSKSLSKIRQAVQEKQEQLDTSPSPSLSQSSMWHQDPLLAEYVVQCNYLPQVLQSSTGILFSMLNAVQIVHSKDMEEHGQTKKNNLPVNSKNSVKPTTINRPKTSTIIKDMNMEVAENESSIDDSILEATFADMVQKDDGEWSEGRDSLVEGGDERAMREIMARRYLVNVSNMNQLDHVYATASANACIELLAFQNDAYCRSQVKRLIGQGGMPLKPKYNKQERSIAESELLTFTSLSAVDIHRYHMQHILNRAIEKSLPPTVNFTGTKLPGTELDTSSLLKRNYFREIPAIALPQILSKELITDPKVFKEYYSHTDQMILAFLWEPPYRRMGKKCWDPSMSMHFKPTFSEYLVLTERQNFTPRTALGLKSAINISEIELKRFQQHSLVINPSDMSTVSVKTLASTQDSWLSVYTRESSVGLRFPENPSRADKRPSPSHRADNADESNDSDKLCNGIFYHQGDEGCRITVSSEFPLNTFEATKKPDKKNFIRSTITQLDGLCVTLSTTGNVIIKSNNIKVKNKSEEEALNDEECSRMVCAGGVVVRFFPKEYPFQREVYCADGSRTLIRTHVPELDVPSPNKRKASVRSTSMPPPASGQKPIPTQKGKGKDSKEGLILEMILEEAPSNWRYIRLGSDGSVQCFTGEPGTAEVRTADGYDNRATSHPSFSASIKKTIIDGETKGQVHEYKDGRVVIIWKEDGLRESHFPDGTRIVTHGDGKVVYIERYRHPSIEVNSEVDIISSKHSKGKQVPIAMGGDRIRTKVCFADGTAAMIKYNTKVTALSNGSIKIVKRSREIIFAEDGGVVTYYPASSWSKQSEKEFLKDCLDDTNSINPKLPQPTPVSPKSKSKATKITDGKIGGKSRKTPLADDSSLASSVISITSAGLEAKAQEKFASDAKDTTKYIFKVDLMTCRIEDHENNIFLVNLNSPQSPVVNLAGEVEGMKPTAVSVTNIEPRLFIINRGASAVELMRFCEMSDIEFRLKTNPDAKMHITEANSLSCDLGGGKLYTYFVKKKLGVDDCFTFDEIFQPREWHHRMHPAAASITLIRVKKFLKTFINNSRLSTTFESYRVIENKPLSIQGYADLLHSFEAWENWRFQRTMAMNKFSTEDLRSDEDIKSEREMGSKLKKAYKVAKALAHKKREKERENHHNHNHGLGRKEDSLDEHDHLDDIPEFPSEDESEDERGEDPLDMEIKSAFDSYCVVYEDEQQRIPLDQLQSAIIQLFNEYISEDFIHRGLGHDIVISNSESLTLTEFRKLYYTMLGMNGSEPLATSLMLSIPLRLSKQPDPIIAVENSSQSQSLSPERNFWNTSVGQSTAAEIEDTSYEKQLKAARMIEARAAGSAVHAARKVGFKT